MKNYILLIFFFLILVCCNQPGSKANSDDTNVVNTQQNNQPLDSLITINGSSIFYKMKGRNWPAIIFISGMGDDHKTWQQVQDSLSNVALTLSYDRCGLGKSPYKHQSKDVASMAEELHSLVNNLHIPKPSIIVGHSLGSQIAKVFAQKHPEYIKAIIFIDPGFNEENLKKELPADVWEARNSMIKKYTGNLNKAQQAEKNELNHSCKTADSIDNLPLVPVVLFTATLINPDFPGSAQELKVKEQTHALWLKDIPGSRHIHVKESRHYIQNDKPEIIMGTLVSLLNEN